MSWLKRLFNKQKAPLKLYAFDPDTHGPYSFTVMARTEDEARGKVEKYIKSNSGWTTDRDPWKAVNAETVQYWNDGKHRCTVYEAGEVVITDND